MSATVFRADALALPLADETVDLVVTSPPYFGLRSYTDGGAHYAGQLGSEPTPAEYVDALLAATREMVRCLKPSGSIWVNLGDTYARQGQDKPQSFVPDDVRKAPRQRLAVNNGVRLKSLQGIPWRYAIACIDQLGLILRAEIIWSKPNGLPESVTDRVRRSHEQWFHFVRQPRYYSAVDEIREAVADGNTTGRTWRDRAATGEVRGSRYAEHIGTDGAFKGGTLAPNPLGKLPGSVWTIPTEPLTVPPGLGVDHFAAFPTEWPRRIIAGWSPPGICVECGEGRRPVTITDLGVKERATPAYIGDARISRHGMGATTLGSRGPSATITGYVCACTPYTDHPGTGEPHRNGDHPSGGNAGSNVNAGTRLSDLGSANRVGPWREYHHDRRTPARTRPATVLDPFAGTGTVPLVADILGRRGIGVDLSADYCRLAAWRTQDPGQRARAARVDKPPPVIDGQLTLEGMP